jgi:hypothetical protein
MDGFVSHARQLAQARNSTPAQARSFGSDGLAPLPLVQTIQERQE